MAFKSKEKIKERLELDELLESVESKKHKLKPLPEYTYEYDADDSVDASLPAAPNTSASDLKKLNELITDFSRLLERSHFREFIEAQEKPWRWHLINFFTSLFKGIGFVFGAALATSSLLFIWSQLNWAGLRSLLQVLRQTF